MKALPLKNGKTLRLWNKALAACENTETLRGCEVSFLQSIFLIENNFRPLWMRGLEYGAMLFFGTMSIAFERPVKSFTIGPCQLGLPTILAYSRGQAAKSAEKNGPTVRPEGGNSLPPDFETGDDTDQSFHDRKVEFQGFKELWACLSAAKLSKSMEILSWRLAPAAKAAAEKYPDRPALQLRALGLEYGGRLSYGLMAEKVWKSFKSETPEPEKPRIK